MFKNRNKILTAKLLRQGYRYHTLRETFSKLYSRHPELMFKHNRIFDLKIIRFLVVKLSIYLNRRVFVMKLLTSVVSLLTVARQFHWFFFVYTSVVSYVAFHQESIPI